MLFRSATIKLTTGEELISKVSYMPDDDSLVLDSPMEVKIGRASCRERV